MFVGAPAPWGERAASYTEASVSHRGTNVPRSAPELGAKPPPCLAAFVALLLQPNQQKEDAMKTLLYFARALMGGGTVSADVVRGLPRGVA